MLQGEEDVVGVFTCKVAIRSVRSDFAGVINKKISGLPGQPVMEGIGLTEHQIEWVRTKEMLVEDIVGLGFPKELGEQVAKQLGSPKAMHRMMSYLYNVKPQSVELVVDEMLAICSEIEEWRDKKECEEANAKYNELLNFGLDSDEWG